MSLALGTREGPSAFAEAAAEDDITTAFPELRLYCLVQQEAARREHESVALGTLNALAC